MARILFAKNIPALEVPDGANLMQSLLAAGRPVASSCYGKGICSKCRVKVLAGGENLSKPNVLEKRLREKIGQSANALTDDERLTCQTRILSAEVTIDTGYW